ncbi:DJ-1/PfpI family protein [Alicyclobacillus macrosporangiidus]|uniref:DJ-1/PfpI family protein n=1 Tax=Alicyclobacillus macrosporangiidus TaxID=392015 RepID=A0A1I7LAJ9_9BACL|nr:DJ-1/PfpI family protein [Alicyclobacillus macrosporangiidus]SFV06753.1 DJ-1/PfpI family protein [Alicyclobacillus macrosporangiidus]
MEKVLLLIYPTFSEFEITVAITVLSREFDMVTVAPRSGLVTGESGLQVMPHTTVQHVDVDEYQALIIPGAEDMIHIKDEEPVFAMVRDYLKKDMYGSQ